MRLRGLSLGLLLLFLLAGCGGKRVPDWIYGNSVQFPEQAYLTGVGVGEDRARAEDRARLEIAKVFQVDIRAREYSSETELHQGSVNEYRQEAASRVTATSGRLLKGVKIADVWREPQQGKWYALAVLERVRAATALRDGIEALDRQVHEQVTLAQQAGSPLRSLGPYRRALFLQQQRNLLAADLRVVDPVAVSAEPVVPSGELEARVAHLAATMKVAVLLDGDRGDIVRSAIVRAMASAGLTLVPELESSVQLQGKIDVTATGPSNGVDWCTATARVELRESGQLIDTIQTTVREGSQEKDRAETLARELLGRRLAEKVLAVVGSPGADQP